MRQTAPLPYSVSIETLLPLRIGVGGTGDTGMYTKTVETSGNITGLPN